MRDRLDSLDPLPTPAHWASIAASTLTNVTEATAALKAGLPQAGRVTGGHDSDFEGEFWSRLNGPRGHVVVGMQPGMSSVGAASIIAAWMGLAPTQLHHDIGGTVSHVVSGVGHRHDQSWHTDSTPWRKPNRYSVLGLVSGTGADDESTDLLALASLEQGLASDPAAWAALRTEAIPWRRNFPHLADLSAPILGTTHPRWVWPVLEELMDEFSRDLRRGVSLVARLINEVAHYSPIVTRSTVLVFDNGRMLHRGPHLEESAGRELIRIKMVGEADV